MAPAIAGRQRPADFAGADRVDQHAVAADEIENRQVRAGLLGVADHVERPQVVDALDDFRGVVDVHRRAELVGQVGDGHAGDLRAEERKFWSRGHAGKTEERADGVRVKVSSNRSVNRSAGKEAAGQCLRRCL